MIKLKKANPIALILIMVMVVGALTTACQPTPEELVVKSKVDDTYMDRINQSNKEKPDETADVAPEATEEKPSLNYAYEPHITETLTPKDDTLHVSFDADVIVPETDALSVVHVHPTKITQEQVDGFLDRFFPVRMGLKAPDLGHIPTKAEIEADILMYMEWIAKKENAGEEVPDFWLEEMAFFKEQLKDAPDEVPDQEDFDSTKFNSHMKIEREAGVSVEDMKKRIDKAKKRIANNRTEWIEYEFYNDVGVKHRVYVLRSDDVYVNSMYISSNKRPNNQYQENDTDIPEMTMTYDAAKSMADEAVQLLGFGYMDVSYSAKTWHEERMGRNKEPKTTPMYYFVYTRDLSGANINYTENHIDAVRLNYRPWHYELFEVWVNDEGLQGVSLHSCPSVLGESITDDAPLLPFDEVMKKARQSFELSILTHSSNAYHLYWADEDSQDIVHDNRIIIDKIVLGYMRIKKGDSPDTCILIPVWDFIGRESVHMDVKHKKDDHYMEEITEMPEKGYGDQHSFLTINAIDGSIIDRSLGY